MNILKPRYIFIIILSSLLFVSIIYNINFKEKIFRYISISIFSFFLYIITTKNNQSKKQYLLSILFILPQISIDFSVIFTNWSFIPLRFPFSSVYPFLGAFCGYLIRVKNKYIWIFIFFLLSFFYLSQKILIPKIIFYIQNREKINISSIKPLYNFINTKGDTVEINLFKNRCNLLEFYFVGCKPCEEKLNSLINLYKNINDKNFNLFIICDGKISNFKQFKKDLKETNDITFLYDYNNVRGSLVNYDTGYPLELLFKYDSLNSTYIGFADLIEINYLKSRIGLIKKILYEK